MTPLTKKEGEELLLQWVPQLQKSLHDAGEKVHKLPATFIFDYPHPYDEQRLHIFDIGHCVLYLALRPSNFDDRYTPVLVVSEKVRRKQKHGVGHAKDYYASRVSGLPSFAKAVQNAHNRNREVEGASTQAQGKGVLLPSGVITSDMPNGNKALHISMMEVTPKQLKALAEVLN